MTNSLLFTKSFIIRGIGYRAQIIDNNWLKKNNSIELQNVSAHEFPNKRYLAVRVGYSHITYLPIPDQVGVLVSKKDRKLIVYSKDQQLVFPFARSIYELRQPSVYTGRGIRVKKFQHRRKVGKKDVRKGRFF